VLDAEDAAAAVEEPSRHGEAPDRAGSRGDQVTRKVNIAEVMSEELRATGRRGIS